MRKILCLLGRTFVISTGGSLRCGGMLQAMLSCYETSGPFLFASFVKNRALNPAFWPAFFSLEMCHTSISLLVCPMPSNKGELLVCSTQSQTRQPVPGTPLRAGKGFDMISYSPLWKAVRSIALRNHPSAL